MVGLQTGHRRAFTAVFLTVLIDTIGFGIIIPVMPALIREVTNLPLADAAPYSGYLLLSFALVQFISTPILGGLSDRFGRRPVILLSLFGYAIDFAIMGLATAYAVLFIGRLASGLFAATLSTANAIIADSFPPDQRAERFGILGAAFGIGFIIGPAIGGLVADAFGTRAPFFAASAMALLNFGFAYFVLPETHPREKRRAFKWRRANPVGNLLHFWKHPAILSVMLGIFLFHVAQMAFISVWAWFATAKFSWQESEIGYSLMAVGLSAAFVQGVLLRSIIARLGEWYSIIVGGVVSITAYLLYAVVPVGWMIYPVVLFGAFGAIAHPAVQSVLTRSTPADAQGELQGAIACVLSLGTIIGPIIMTQTFSLFSGETAAIQFPGAPFLISALLVTLSGIPILFALRRLPAEGPRIASMTVHAQATKNFKHERC